MGVKLAGDGKMILCVFDAADAMETVVCAFDVRMICCVGGSAILTAFDLTATGIVKPVLTVDGRIGVPLLTVTNWVFGLVDG